MATVWIVIEDTGEAADPTEGVFDSEQKATAHWRELMTGQYGEDDDDWPDGEDELPRYIVRDHPIQ